jgi:hypothetical protein
VLIFDLSQVDRLLILLQVVHSIRSASMLFLNPPRYRNLKPAINPPRFHYG